MTVDLTSGQPFLRDINFYITLAPLRQDKVRLPFLPVLVMAISSLGQARIAAIEGRELAYRQN